jgi:hypothetical protein
LRAKDAPDVDEALRLLREALSLDARGRGAAYVHLETARLFVAQGHFAQARGELDLIAVLGVEDVALAAQVTELARSIASADATVADAGTAATPGVPDAGYSGVQEG